MARRKSEDKIQVISNVDESIREVTAYDLVKSAYLEYGGYINNWRQLPQILDGFKISYRRLLYSAIQFPPGKMVKSANLLGKMMECHPHDTSGSYSVVCAFSKAGIFDMQGFGGCRSIDGTDSPAAAPRYTEVKVSDKYLKLLGKLIKKVPYVESPIGNPEPTYIPTPLPFSFFCLRGDTKVKQVDGTDITMKELDDLVNKGTTIYVFSCDSRGDYMISKVTESAKTKSTNKYIRITLDNDEVINITEDHKVMRIDGTYLEAQYLRVGDRLMHGNINLKMTRLNRSEDLLFDDSYMYSVTKIEKVEEKNQSDFYDISVDSRFHNFLLSSGVVVHNCSDSSVSGLGLGISTDLPSFSPRSMYQAFIHDDPSLLEPNIDIILNKEKSDLNGIWYNGRGRVTYEYKISRIKGPEGNPGVLIEGDSGIFTPNLKRIMDWQSEGKAYKEDMVTQDGAKLAIYKVPNIKSLSIDDIEAEVRRACINNMTYSLNISDGGSAFRIPLREWIKATYNNYINLINSDNEDSIREVEFDILVASNLEKIANYVINVNPKADDAEIATQCGTTMEVVAAVMSRSISNLRKTKSQDEKVKQLNQKLKELKKFNAVKFTEEIVERL